MFTVAGGILVATFVLAALGFVVMLISHWFSTSGARASQKKWEAEMRAKHPA